MGLHEGILGAKGPPLCGLKTKWTLEKGEPRISKNTCFEDAE